MPPKRKTPPARTPQAQARAEYRRRQRERGYPLPEGRPPLDESGPLVSIKARVPGWMRDALIEAGGGNLSEGVRRMFRHWEKKLKKGVDNG